MVGLDRFELSNDGVKVRCLTPWLYPNLTLQYLLYHNLKSVSSTFQIILLAK